MKPLLLLALLVPAAQAQFSHPDCANLAATDFKAVEVFNKNGTATPLATDGTLEEPVQFDLHGIRSGDSVTHVDIYFVQRLGAVKRYDGAAKKVSTLGTIPNWGKVDNGLMGLALHPDFAKNRWIYFWYSPNQLAGQNRKLRLTRITVTADWKLDMGSEKILIEILGSKTDSYHSGGPMAFDGHGDLWVTVGNNSPDLDPASLNVLSTTDSTQSAEWGPSNTASLRGGIFRIHPDSSAKGYSVPKGNFGEHWAAEFEKQGKAALAAQYRDPKKVLPEVYVKGNRSNYSIAVHPTKRWLAWGEVNYSNSNDEYNLVTKPTFAGFPYFHANNAPTGNHGKSAASPVNISPFNSGVSELPPAVPGTINNLANVAIGGPLYVFDASLRSPVKFPPHLHNTWLTMGWSSGQVHIHTLDSVQVTVTKTQRADNGILSTAKLRRPLQGKYGPEGALYLLNYDGSYNSINPGVTRVDYVGACRIPVSARRAAPAPALDLIYTSATLKVGEAGDHTLSLLDVSGVERLRRSGTQGAAYRFADLRREAGLKPGLYIVRIETSRGAYLRQLSFL